MIALRRVSMAELGALRAAPGVQSAELFGQGAHVRLDSSADERAWLPPGATAEVIEPSLEDVFLAAVQTPPSKGSA